MHRQNAVYSAANSETEATPVPLTCIKVQLAGNGLVSAGLFFSGLLSIDRNSLYEGPLELHEYAETLRNLGTILCQEHGSFGSETSTYCGFRRPYPFCLFVKEMGKSKYKSELRRWEKKVCGSQDLLPQPCKSNDALDRPDYPPLPTYLADLTGGWLSDD